MPEVKRRKFTPEFKYKIVNLKLFKNIPTKKICEKYDLDPQTVHRWVKEFEEAAMAGWEEQDKKLKMQKRIKELEMEIEIMKKFNEHFSGKN